ncbi:phosphatase PAP2 family protein [Noviherbaspirillum massiliense]|uniref:phosphatase PAP2 family protein n=1 Tax=Noviherbaspirillum massiliense TaxID=1465823 RepID=UPI0002DECB24|nr:phosphatase PAP2 family protein [Noviherbaspirillum massiliense]
MQSYRNSPWAWLPPLIASVLLGVVYFTDSNRELFLALNRSGHVLGDVWWANLTILGDGAVALALVAPWIKRSPQRFWAALFAAVFAALWVQGIKHVINVPRPLAVFPPEEFFHYGPAFRARAFPSGHAAAIFAVAGIWIMSLSRHYLLRTLLFILAVLVSLSRVMVGVHWPLDLLGGMLGGWLAAWAGLALVGRRTWKTSGIGGYLAGIVLLAIAAALLVSNHMRYPNALAFQRVLGIICLVWGAREMILMLPRRSMRGSAEEN